MYRITGANIDVRLQFANYIRYFLECIVLEMNEKEYYNLKKAEKRQNQRDSLNEKIKYKYYLSNGKQVDVFRLKYIIHKFISDFRISKLKNNPKNLSTQLLENDIYRLFESKYQDLIIEKLNFEKSNGKILLLVDINFNIPNETKLNISNLLIDELFELAHKTSLEIIKNYGI